MVTRCPSSSPILLYRTKSESWWCTVGLGAAWTMRKRITKRTQMAARCLLKSVAASKPQSHLLLSRNTDEQKDVLSLLVLFCWPKSKKWSCSFRLSPTCLRSWLCLLLFQRSRERLRFQAGQLPTQRGLSSGSKKSRSCTNCGHFVL